MEQSKKYKLYSQLLPQYNQIYFMRMFYYIEMNYGKTYYFALYYQHKNILQQTYNKSILLIDLLHPLRMDYKLEIIGYDKVFNKQELIKEKLPDVDVIENNEGFYFITRL